MEAAWTAMSASTLATVAASVGGIGALALGAKLVRPLLPQAVNCWFCDRNCLVPFGNRNCWDCPHCDQYNGFKDDGSYNKEIPAQHEEALNSAKCFSTVSSPASPVTSFCADCNRNQLIKIKQLAAFSPLNEDTFDEEVERFQKRLDVNLALCGRCEAKAEAVLDQQNKELMYDIASDALLKTTSRNKNHVTHTETSLRQYRFCTTVKLCHLVLLVVALSLVAIACLNYPTIFQRLEANLLHVLDPEISLANTTLTHFLLPLFTPLAPHSLALSFVGIFGAIISVYLKSKAKLYAGYSDLISILSWLCLVVVQLASVLSAGLRDSTAEPRWLTAIDLETMESVAVGISSFTFVASLVNFVIVLTQKPKSWRRKDSITSARRLKNLVSSSKRITFPIQRMKGVPSLISHPTVSPVPTPLPSSPLTPPSRQGSISAAFPGGIHFPSPSTSTPPFSRPPSPIGSIIGEGVELRMGDIAGMTLSSGLTPKKKDGRPRRSDCGPFTSGGGGGSSVWGKAGLNTSFTSSSGSSTDRNKPKTIIMPAKFKASKPRASLPSAVFGSSAGATSGCFSNPQSRPASPNRDLSNDALKNGWGRHDLWSGPNVAEDAMSTVSAPSRFAPSSGVGLFAGGFIGPPASKPTTPRGSDNTSSSDPDWPQSPSHPTFQVCPTDIKTSPGSPSFPQAFNDTFTDDSDSEECLADATMKQAERRKSLGRRRQRKTSESSSSFMKVAVVVSVIGNVVLAFYLGTLMKA